MLIAILLTSLIMGIVSDKKDCELQKEMKNFPLHKISYSRILPTDK